jgi:TPR repeat protein
MLASYANLLLEGRTCLPKNHLKAFFLARLGAKKGCPHSKGVLARCFFAGYGCQADETQAMCLAQESAVTGSRYGLFVLGSIAYEKNDITTAKNYWQKAADLDLAVAQINLGSLLLLESQELRRVLEKKDNSTLFNNVLNLEQKAFHLFLEAAHKGHPIGLQELGLMYHDGIGTSVDMKQASRYFLLSRLAGNIDLKLT